MEPTSHNAERELVGRCLRGEPAAWAGFVECYQRLVFSICLRLLGQREDAEDVAQETLVRAIRHLDQWDATRSLKPWLITIAVNCCRTRLARRARQPQLTDDLASVPASSAGDQRSASNDLAEELQRALAQLRPEYRECFVLFYQQELSIEEVAAVLDCPPGTIKTWLHRARKILAAELERRGIGPAESP